MKTPLRYQITEFDCGSVSLINCITFLFERNEIPAELVKAISSYTLDCYDEHGNLGAKGTSREAVKYLTKWIATFSESKDFGISCKYLDGKKVTVNQIKQCIKNGGCINWRTYQTCEHYVTITGIDKDYVYVFDPYYMEGDFYDSKKQIAIFADRKFDYNRKVKMERFLSEKRQDFALGPVEKREVVLINRK